MLYRSTILLYKKKIDKKIMNIRTFLKLGEAIFFLTKAEMFDAKCRKLYVMCIMFKKKIVSNIHVYMFTKSLIDLLQPKYIYISNPYIHKIPVSKFTRMS